MKVVIFAGGLGTRLAEITERIPKPLVKIGTMPIIWHIMKIYSQYGYNEFILPLGYKSELIKEFFLNLKYIKSDFTIDTSNGEIKMHQNNSDNWKITFVDTGLNTMTGGRLLKLQQYIGEEKFLLTYGDGLANVNINKLLEFHSKNKKMVTITAVRPAARFGEIKILKNTHNVSSFREKPRVENGWINGGFFVCEPELFKYLNDDSTVLEHEPLQQICLENELVAYKHDGFWQCMDNKKDHDYLNNLWEENKRYWLYPQCITNISDKTHVYKAHTNKKEFFLNVNNLTL